MPSTLNIRNIGDACKAALESEAQRRGISVAEVVRPCIDEGISRARAEREGAAWFASAKADLADEAWHLEENSPTLARFRRP